MSGKSTDELETANENLHRAIRLTREMLALSDEGDRDRIDDSCGILYGVMRDMAYRLRRMAKEEYEKHMSNFIASDSRQDG